MAEGLNVIAGYQQSDTDTTNTSPQYYGFLNSTGAYYIQQYTISSGVQTFRYYASSGLSKYQTDWTNRASLTYDYFSNIFTNS